MQTPEIEFMKEVIVEVIKILPADIGTHVAEILEFRVALQSESDRATALMAAAFLEDYLGKLISHYMIDDNAINKMVFAHNGPLGTFSAKIDMAYMLALISPVVRKDLHLLRKIRNEFAHTAKPLDFTDHRIKSRCEEFKCGGLPPKKDNPRTKFNRTMMIIAQDIALQLSRSERLNTKAETIQPGAGKSHIQTIIEFMRNNSLDPSALEDGIDLQSK